MICSQIWQIILTGFDKKKKEIWLSLFHEPKNHSDERLETEENFHWIAT